MPECSSHFPVHPTDSLRVDVVIPYEQRFYLKAPSQMQRHAWLVALGNAKAGLPPSIQPTSPPGNLCYPLAYSGFMNVFIKLLDIFKFFFMTN